MPQRDTESESPQPVLLRAPVCEMNAALNNAAMPLAYSGGAGASKEVDFLFNAAFGRPARDPFFSNRTRKQAASRWRDLYFQGYSDRRPDKDGFVSVKR